MAGRQATPERGEDPTAIYDRAFWIVVVLAIALGVLMVARLLADATAPAGESGSTNGGSAAGGSASASQPAPSASIDVDAYLEFFARPAPPLELTGPDGERISLDDYRGGPVLVFFGYTHCPDVCPATIGAVGQAIEADGARARAIFVSVDPERDTIPWLAEFVRYMPAGFTAVTGSPVEVRTTADAWGVRYAKVDTGDPAAYSMSHTADVFVVDGAGQFRARLPFGTTPEAITEVLRVVAATTEAPAPSATPFATREPGPSASATVTAPTETSADIDLWPQVVSSSIWGGGTSPVILALFDDVGGRVGDPTVRVTAQLLDAAGAPLGDAVDAVRVQPPGMIDVSYVPTLDIPGPGRWRLSVDAIAADGTIRHGIADLTALDPGGTPLIGAPAPTVHTPTAADVGGDLTWVTTDPLPDPRLSSTSTTDALGAGRPFVLVVDSYSFKVTPACGKAVAMAKRLLDRWTDVPFIHHEPYRYSVVTTEPVLEGSLSAPVLTDVADAWGVGSAPWGVGSMPWLFIVDGDGIVRAKYQGVMGTADVDVLLSMLAEAG